MRLCAAVLLMAVLSGPTWATPQHPFIRPDGATPAVSSPRQTPVEPPPGDVVAFVPERRFDSGFKIVVSAYVLSSVLDLTTTKGALSRGGRETNWLLARDDGRRVAYGGYIALGLAQIALTSYIEKKGPRWLRVVARIQLVIATGQRFNAAYNNYQVGR